MRIRDFPAPPGIHTAASDGAAALAGPRVCHRRAFMLAAGAFAALPIAAAKPSPPPRTANIRWPGPGHDLHGYMAIPARAHGPQPAVLVVHDIVGADDFTRRLTDALAQAGFVTCAPNKLASLEEATATVRWLATNAYATGRVGAIGIGWGTALVDRIAAASEPPPAAAVTLGASDPAGIPAALPLLRLAPLDGLSGDAYAAEWRQMIAFLRQHLA